MAKFSPDLKGAYVTITHWSRGVERRGRIESVTDNVIFIPKTKMFEREHYFLAEFLDGEYMIDPPLHFKGGMANVRHSV